MTALTHISSSIMNWVHTLPPWEAAIVAFVMTFHDFVLWPIFFLIGRISRHPHKKPGHKYKKLKRGAK